MSTDLGLQYMATFPHATTSCFDLSDQRGASRFNTSAARHDTASPVTLELVQPRNVMISLKRGADGPIPFPPSPPKKMAAPARAPPPVSCPLVLAPATQHPIVVVQLAPTQVVAEAARQRSLGLTSAHSLGLASASSLLEPSALRLFGGDNLSNEGPHKDPEETEGEDEQVMLPQGAAALADAGRLPTFARLESCDVNAVLDELVRHPSAMGRVPLPLPSPTAGPPGTKS